MIINFVIDLLSSHWRDHIYDIIFIMMNVFIKYSWYFSCSENIIAKNLAELLYERFFTLYETLKTLVFNQEFLFISKFWSSLCFFLDVRRRLLIAYYSQMNDQMKRQNQMFKHYLRCYTNFNQDDWTRWILMFQFVYNNFKHSVTNKFSTMTLIRFRSHLRANVETDSKHFKIAIAVNHVTYFEKIRFELTSCLEKTHKFQKKYYNKTHLSQHFKIEDKIFIKTQNMQMLRFFWKLNHKYIDLFEIVKV